MSETVALARNAMATRFEVVLHGDDSVSLRAAGEQALDEIERLEARLSLYLPSSEISRINARAAGTSVRVSPEIFSLLRRVRELSDLSGGAFDITVAPLVRCWGFMRGQGSLPDEKSIAASREAVGAASVLLGESDRTVRFERDGMMLDLGAVGKGYAVDCAVDILREAGVASALVHGGTSTIYGLGRPPGADAWRIAVQHPIQDSSPGSNRASSLSLADSGEEEEVAALVDLKDEALSVSAPAGKGFTAGGRHFGHVLDPRTGWPVEGATLSAVVAPAATDTDALSTALLILGVEGHDRIANAAPSLRTLVIGHSNDGENPGEVQCAARGIVLLNPPRSRG